MMACSAPDIDRRTLHVEPADARGGSTAIGSGADGTTLVAWSMPNVGVRVVALAPHASGELPVTARRLSDDRRAGSVALHRTADGWLVAWSAERAGHALVRACPVGPDGVPTAAPYTVAEVDVTDARPALAAIGGQLLSAYARETELVVRGVGTDASDVGPERGLGPAASSTEAFHLASAADRGVLGWIERDGLSSTVYVRALTREALGDAEPWAASADARAEGPVTLRSGDYGTSIVYHDRISAARPRLRFRQLTRAPGGDRWPVQTISAPSELAAAGSMDKLSCGYAVAYRAETPEGAARIRLAFADEIGSVTDRVELSDAWAVSGRIEHSATATSARHDGSVVVAWLERERNEVRLESAVIRCIP